MARIIQTSTKSNVGFRIVNQYVDGTSSYTDFYENDEVTDLSYVDHEEVCTISGRISKINVTPFNVVSRSSKTITKPLNEVMYVASLVIDHSETNQSKITVVPSREVLEYGATKEIKRVEIVPILSVNLKVTLSDNTSTKAVITPGCSLFDVTTIGGGIEFTSSLNVKSVYYVIDPNQDVCAKGMITNEAQPRTIPFMLVKSCGSQGVTAEAGQKLTDVFTAASTDGSTGGVTIPAATFADAVSVKGSLEVFGNMVGVAANSGARCTDALSADETVIANTVTFEKDADVVMNGVAFTDKSYVTLNGAKSVTFTNCKFTTATAYQAKSFLFISGGAAEDPATKLIIENCYFGNNTVTGTKKYYNTFELGCKLADGSAIRNCYFEADVCTHNIINLYRAEEGATITIEGNYFEKSVNAIRIGFKGDTTCTVNVKNNTYTKTDEIHPEYAGLMLVQPYSTETTTMKHVRINIENTKKPEGQLFYFEIGKVGVPFEVEDHPEIYVDGIRQ